MLSRCCCSFLVQETFLALLLQSTQLCNEYLASAGEGKWGTHMRNMCALPARRLTMCAPPSAICQAPMNTTLRAPWGKTYKQYVHFERRLTIWHYMCIHCNVEQPYIEQPYYVKYIHEHHMCTFCKNIDNMSTSTCYIFQAFMNTTMCVLWTKTDNMHTSVYITHCIYCDRWLVVF